MSIDIQIISLIIYYLFGIFLYIAMLFLRRKKALLIIPISYAIFIIVNYHINKLIIHPYFLGFLIIGFITSKIYVKGIKRLESLLKHKNMK